MGIRTPHERGGRSAEGFEAALHVEVDPYLALEEAHDSARRLGAAIREEYPRLLKVNSHIEVAEPEPGNKREITEEHQELAAKIGRTVSEAQVDARAHEVRLYRPEGTDVDADGIDAVVHCDFPPSTNMGEVHRRTELIEQLLRTRMPELGLVFIHAEPTEGT
jgi:divalent metal cation (Fe/Co/Zn/Cd) transporter